MNILACGALANELIALKNLNHWQHLKITCLPVHYHQTPHKIPLAVDTAIEKIRQHSDEQILVAYGDCGTGGLLDKVLLKHGVERLPGAHCYAFFAGCERFDQLHEAEVGTFYLTDFLVAHFDTYVWCMLGLDKQPDLLEMYFGNYKKLTYLAQTKSKTLKKQALQHAHTLGLEFDYIYTGYGELGGALEGLIRVAEPKMQNRTTAMQTCQI